MVMPELLEPVFDDDQTVGMKELRGVGCSVGHTSMIANLLSLSSTLWGKIEHPKADAEGRDRIPSSSPENTCLG
jgi:hypothetical protein